MKGGQPFIFIPQGRVCRPEERLECRFLCRFPTVRRSRTGKATHPL